MIVPLTRQKFEQIIPLVASGPQYKYYWGKLSNFVQRILISVVTLAVLLLDWWITDRLMGKQETVNGKGELVIIENREKRINLEIGDETGFSVEFEAPLRNAHKVISRGQIAEMVVMSNSPDLSTIEEFSDIYIPSRDLWVSDYPYVRKDFFNEVSVRLRANQERKPRRRSPKT
jgi:hypothetical protein